MTYRVKLGSAVSDPMSKDEAEEAAELLWQRRHVHTQVVDEHGVVVCEFEV